MPEPIVETNIEHHDDTSYRQGVHIAVDHMMDEMDADPLFEGGTAILSEELVQPEAPTMPTVRVSAYRATSTCEVCLFCDGRGFVESGE